MVYGIILAGGKGERMKNSEIPKQFINLGNKPIILYSIDQFCKNDKIDQIIVLCPKEWISYCHKTIKQYIEKKNIIVIEGGEHRNHTILNAIDYIENNFGLSEQDILVTHDAVRPFLSQKIINDNIRSMENEDACDTVIPATDTIIESENGLYISNIPDRSKLYQGQTPQTFKANIFKELYHSLTENEKQILTDAIKVFTIKGINVSLVAGCSTNIKITYSSDIEIAKSFLENNYFEK